MSIPKNLRDEFLWLKTQETDNFVTSTKRFLLTHDTTNETSDVMPQFRKSLSSSTCNSDDSGIDRTVNLTPLLGDSESDDFGSLDGDVIPVPRSRTSPSASRTTSVNSCTNSATSFDLGISHSIDELHLGPIPAHWPVTVGGNNEMPRSDTQAAYVDGNRYCILTSAQVYRLHHLLSEPVPIHSRVPDYPVIWVRLIDLFSAVRDNLHRYGVPVRNIRLNGGAASYVIDMTSEQTYNDIDVLISVDLSSHCSTSRKVKAAVLDALMQFIPDSSASRNRHPHCASNTCCTGQSGVYPRYDVLQEKQSTPITNLHSPILDVNTLQHTEPNSLGSDSDELESNLASISTEPTNISPNTLPSTASKMTPLHIHGLTDVIDVTSNRMFPSSSSNCSTASPSTPVTPPPFIQTPDDTPVRESYIYKQFRKYSLKESDCWSLLSLGVPSLQSKVVEFKFVDRMQRQFEFTIDSFQILLDSMLSFNEANNWHAMTPNFYPTVVAESVAGSFKVASYHLKNKLILTTQPEMIRGGGLLKYCRLLISGYTSPDGVDICSLERYMSSRFFIDFQDLCSQKTKIEAFLANHFSQDEVNEKIVFLKTIYRVVSDSSICLMSHERFQTLNMISGLMDQLLRQARTRQISVPLDALTRHADLRIDEVIYGNECFPKITQALVTHCNCGREQCVHHNTCSQTRTIRPDSISIQNNRSNDTHSTRIPAAKQLGLPANLSTDIPMTAVY